MGQSWPEATSKELEKHPEERGDTIPEQVALGCKRKPTEYELDSEPASGIPLWFLFQFLP